MPAPPCPMGSDPAALLAWAARVRAAGDAAAAESRRLLRLLSSGALHGQAGDALADLGRRVAHDLDAVARLSHDAADQLVAAAARVPRP